MQNFSEELKREAFDFAFAVHRVTELFPKDEALRKELREHSAAVLARVSGLEFAENSDKLTLIRNILAVLEALKNLMCLSQKLGLMKAINAEVLERERTAMEIYFQHEYNVLTRGQTAKEQKRDENKPKGKAQNDLAAINDTKISVSDILEAQKQPTKTQLAAPSPSIISNSATAEGIENNAPQERHGAIIDYLRANKEAKMTELVNIFSNRFSIKTLQRDLVRLIASGTVAREGDKRWAVYRLNEL